MTRAEDKGGGRGEGFHGARRGKRLFRDAGVEARCDRRFVSAYVGEDRHGEKWTGRRWAWEIHLGALADGWDGVKGKQRAKEAS